MFFKIGDLKNRLSFAIFTRKHWCWSLFYKIAVLQACEVVKRDSKAGVFL